MTYAGKSHQNGPRLRLQGAGPPNPLGFSKKPQEWPV